MAMVSDLLVFLVLQPYQVVSHTQRRDDEVDQSQDTVEPQKAVPVPHKKGLNKHRDVSALFHDI